MSFRTLFQHHSMKKDSRGRRPVGRGGRLFGSNDKAETSASVGSTLPAGAVALSVADPKCTTTFYTMTLCAGLPGQGVSCTTSEQFVHARFHRLSRITGSSYLNSSSASHHAAGCSASCMWCGGP